MLKIKSNINEFTIIFLRRFEGKNECKRIFFSVFSASALFSFVLCSTLFLVKHLSFASFSASFLLSSCSPTFFSFLFDVLPYIFSPKHFFSPNTFSTQELFICGSAPPSFLLFSPSFFLKRLILFFLPTSKAKNILSSCFTSLLFE